MKKIAYSKAAGRAMLALPNQVRQLIRAKLEQYATDPKSQANNVKRLQGEPYLRLRIGDYRVVFFDEKTVITVVRIGHRKEIYR